MRSQLKILLAQKEVKENRTISLRKVAEETGVSISAVNRLANNTIKEIPVSALESLCDYLKCGIGDLLKLEETVDA